MKFINGSIYWLGIGNEFKTFAAFKVMHLLNVTQQEDAARAHILAFDLTVMKTTRHVQLGTQLERTDDYTVE